MRETVIGRWVAILTMIFALPLTVQANTTDTTDSRILESRYLSVPMHLIIGARTSNYTRAPI